MTAPQPTSPVKIDLIRMTVLAAFINGGAVGLLSGDWACTAIGTGIIGAGIAAIAALCASRWMRSRRSVIAVVLVITFSSAAFQTLWTRNNLRRSEFVEAFGGEAPEGIRDYRVSRSYAGGPGDSVTLMRFSADRQTLDQLIAQLPTSNRNEMFDEYAAGHIKAQQLWDSLFLTKGRSPSWWPDAPTLSHPFLHTRFQNTGKSPITTKTIVIDRTSREVYVMITRG